MYGLKEEIRNENQDQRKIFDPATDLISATCSQLGLVAQLVERRWSNPEVAGSNPAGVKDFSLILVLISNFFFQAVRPGGNYVGQYCSLLALIHILYMFIYFISECYGVHHITLDNSWTVLV